MTVHAPFDRPVWASLMHAPAIAEGSDLAQRYRRDIHLFASSRDDSDEASVAALAPLVAPGETVYILQTQPAPVPPGLQVLRRAEGVQMLAAQPVTPQAGDAQVIALDDADAADMLALAQLTEPGPFLPRTHTMGRFIGIRVGGGALIRTMPQPDSLVGELAQCKAMEKSRGNKPARMKSALA